MPNNTPDLDRLWTWTLHEDNLYDSRFARFSTLHAILAAALGILYQQTQRDLATDMLALCFLGVVLSVVWFWVQQRSDKLLRSLQGRLKKDPLFDEVIHGMGKDRFYQTGIMITVPLVMLVIWCVLGLSAMGW